ncbi:MAG: hypothetical protein A2Z16_02865 [Chloroflexi bacterium RBG_16_54_18]|nr:MAG: hypothetical protein A2Z16_02865 [Chloroflexi bacterium RBG_16_54_18]
MNESGHLASQADKLEFLRLVIDSAEKRRDSVENKASILIASNAILLTALASLLPSLVAGRSAGSIKNAYEWVPVALGALTLIAVVVSTMSAIRILVSIPTDKDRKRIMDVDGVESNLLYFGKIAERTKAEYQAAIDTMTDQMILEQLVEEAHNVARLTRERYRFLYFSHRAFFVSVVLFLSVMMSKMFAL